MTDYPNSLSSPSTKKFYFPPLLQFFVYFIVGYILTRVFPALSFNEKVLLWLSVPMIGIGILLLILAVRIFVKADTTINPIEASKASSLVTWGLYRFTRNPMYLGLLITIIGGSLALQNLAALCGPVLFFISMTILQIKPEEHVLKSKFGKTYIDYCKQTRRWL